MLGIMAHLLLALMAEMVMDAVRAIFGDHWYGVPMFDILDALGRTLQWVKCFF